MENIVLIIVIALIIAVAVRYIYKAKKAGSKCIGCPYGKMCEQKNSSPNCDCKKSK